MKTAWFEKAKKIYRDRGYLVVARIYPLRIGEVVTHVHLTNRPHVELPQPFSVIAETTAEDYAVQHQHAELPLSVVTESYHFYRIVTD